MSKCTSAWIMQQYLCQCCPIKTYCCIIKINYANMVSSHITIYFLIAETPKGRKQLWQAVYIRKDRSHTNRQAVHDESWSNWIHGLLFPQPWVYPACVNTPARVQPRQSSPFTVSHSYTSFIVCSIHLSPLLSHSVVCSLEFHTD